VIFFTAGKGKSTKEIAQILVRFQAAGFGCLNQAVEGGGSLGSVGVTVEQPVFTTDHKGTGQAERGCESIPDPPTAYSMTCDHVGWESGGAEVQALRTRPYTATEEGHFPVPAKWVTCLYRQFF
jgi:hypothetical protein